VTTQPDWLPGAGPPAGFALDALPERSTGRTTAAQVERLVMLDGHPELPPDLG
jgi:hypothetical protein